MLPFPVRSCPLRTNGTLISVLADWCPRLSACHLYYPNRKPPAAFALVIEALKHKG